ncbi:MAG: hypothetical protein ACQESF_07095, partial [Nanobdellota archaeon]
MNKKKLQAQERLFRKRMFLRFYIVIFMLVFGFIIGLIDTTESLQKLGEFARLAGVLALGVYCIFFIKRSILPERIESLHAMVQSGIIGLFIYSAAGFIIMILGKN